MIFTLCDDISMQLGILQELIKSYISENNLDAAIRTFKSGEDLLCDFDKNGDSDIYFLDMLLPGMKGISIGRELRKRGASGKIIYITSTAEYAVESYQVEAYNYVLKPVSRQKLFGILDKATKDIIRRTINDKMQNSDDMLVEIKTIDGKKLIKASAVNYIEIQNRRLCYHLCGGEMLEGTMLRCTFAEATVGFTESPELIYLGAHLLVNVGNIDSLDMSCVVFRDGEKLFPSRKYCTMIFDYLKNF